MVSISLLYKSSECLISAEGEFFYRKPAQLVETTGQLPFLDGASRLSPRSPKKSHNLITFGNDCNIDYIRNFALRFHLLIYSFKFPSTQTHYSKRMLKLFCEKNSQSHVNVHFLTVDLALLGEIINL